MSKYIQRFEVAVNNDFISYLMPVEFPINENNVPGVSIPEPQTESVMEDAFGIGNSITTIPKTDCRLKSKNRIKLLKLDDVLAKDKVPKRTKIKQTSVEIKHRVHIPDQIVRPRAEASVPKALIMRHDAIFPRRSLPPLTRFGPIQGVTTKIFPAEASELVYINKASCTPVFLLKRNTDSVHVIETKDKDKSNWLSLLPLGNEATANVWIYEEENALYGITVKTIPCRTPLAFGYSKSYVESHLLLPGQAVLDLDEAIAHLKTAGDLVELPSHMEDYKKDKVRVTRKGYRCAHCLMRFSRIFTYKRHVASYCKKKPDEKNKSLETTFKIDTDMKEPLLDDSKVPSDESFQNYTNNLDFSTHLFGAQLIDRIPNLDMSSSRSETEFNPYSLGDRDEIIDTELVTSDIKNPKLEESIQITCPHCEMPVLKEKYRFHFRDCSKRRFVCECGAAVYNQEMLSQHILKEHTQLGKEDDEEKKDFIVQDDEPYTCNQCGCAFKRRGMLVNHLWRAHGAAAAATAGPIRYRDKRYPCAATNCTKIYRSAAKRDQHVKRHHPGCDPRAASPVAGGPRALPAAACTACPRQYATRAKLLQHMRLHHPRLAMNFVNTKNQLPTENKITSKDKIPRQRKRKT